MNTRRLLLFGASHAAIGAAGFAAGIYTLPILIAPDSPGDEQLREVAGQARFTGTFRRDLEGSDALHWGEGEVTIGRRAIALRGRLAPGPDYRLYLSPEFVQTERDFERVRPRMVHVGHVRTFENFLVEVPEGIDPAAFDTVIVWCERFREFITAAKYR